jgi:hypothetical protein
MFGRLLCFLGRHKWATKGEELAVPGWTKVKCLRPGCKWVELSNYVTKETKHINALIFEVKTDEK